MKRIYDFVKKHRKRISKLQLSLTEKLNGLLSARWLPMGILFSNFLEDFETRYFIFFKGFNLFKI